MKRATVTLTITYETDFDEEDWIKYNPNTTVEEALQSAEYYIVEDEIESIDTRAANVLPSNYQMDYEIKWEDICI